MIRTFRECSDLECVNFDPECEHGHFDEEIQKEDVGKLVSECWEGMTDVREELKKLRGKYKEREDVWRIAVNILEGGRNILGIPPEDSFDSVVFNDAIRALKHDRNQYEELWRHATTKKTVGE